VSDLLPAPVPVPAIKTVLIVEDERDLSYLLECVLHEAGYSTTCARNGAEALSHMRAELPDLIVSDLMMPVMTGIELCETLASNERYTHIPVIIVSSECDVKTADGCNCVGRIPKPIDLDSLLIAVESSIGH
jgi:CheY-like chemotaxis protein